MLIVGGHFLIVVPAFGLIIACLVACCIANASACKWVARYPVSGAWLVAGALKVAFGLVMLLPRQPSGFTHSSEPFYLRKRKGGAVKIGPLVLALHQIDCVGAKRFDRQ